MISDIKQAIATTLNGLYPEHMVFDEYVEQGFAKGSFFIDVIESEARSGINGTCTATHTFDLSYFPADDNNRRNECLEVQETLLRSLTCVGGFRIFGKTANIVDEILHVGFKVKCMERAGETAAAMQSIKITRRF